MDAGGTHLTTQFTCFSSTKVQILTLEDEEVLDEWMREVLSLLALLVQSTDTDASREACSSCRTRSSVYVLYWYKRTDTDAIEMPAGPAGRVLSLLVLLVQKCRY